MPNRDNRDRFSDRDSRTKPRKQATMHARKGTSDRVRGHQNRVKCRFGLSVFFPEKNTMTPCWHVVPHRPSARYSTWAAGNRPTCLTYYTSLATWLIEPSTRCFTHRGSAIFDAHTAISHTPQICSGIGPRSASPMACKTRSRGIARTKVGYQTRHCVSARSNSWLRHHPSKRRLLILISRSIRTVEASELEPAMRPVAERQSPILSAPRSLGL